MRQRLIFLMFLVLNVFIFIDGSYAQEGFPYCEPFTDGKIPENTIFGGDAKFVADVSGSGVLQLTSNQLQQSGYLYIDIPFPSNYGIKASFEYFSYGGEGNADGMTVFLFDASVPYFRPGGFGGALGYAFNSSHQSPGLTGAYIGIGLDEYGNFTNPIEGKDGPGFQPNNITIRGPGEGFKGYDYITGKRTDTEVDGLPEADQFPISSGGPNTQRVTDSNKAGYREVFIDLQPAATGKGMVLNLEMLVTTTDNEHRTLSIFKDFSYNYQAPNNLKIGFSAATGGYTNFHEIRNIVVEVSDDENLQLPEVKPKYEAICRGETKQFKISDDDVLLLNENSVISCLQVYRTLEEILDDEEQDPCLNQACSPDRQQLTLPEGVVTADVKGGGITFESASGLGAEEVMVYYTVTDNYGKTSKPEPLTMTFFDYPESPVIFKESEFEEEGRVPASDFTLCDGDQLRLKVLNPSGVPLQWYIDGVEIEGEVSDVLQVVSAGRYTVGVFGEANCTRLSQEVKITYPSLPAITVEPIIVSCLEGFIDLRLYIEEYDDSLFDYEAIGPDGYIYRAEELVAIEQSGIFNIRSKFKDLNCWSEFFTTDLLLVEAPVEAAFELAVMMADGSLETGDVFAYDTIQFTDLSAQNPSEWDWDFGDGVKSNEQNPQHIFSEEGNFVITLTVYGENGHCSSIKELEVNITSSYRIMYPTAFTPLGSENRYFKPKTKGIEKMSLYIFNSWGDLIYTSDDIILEGWDGNVGGKLQPNGNYVFKVAFTTILGEKIVDSGKFTLIR